METFIFTVRCNVITSMTYVTKTNVNVDSRLKVMFLWHEMYISFSKKKNLYSSTQQDMSDTSFINITLKSTRSELRVLRAVPELCIILPNHRPLKTYN